MSDTHITDEGPPLDPHTLRVVIERISHLRAQYAGAGFQDHEWALANAAAIISRLLATTSDRARVVVLPEPDQVGGQNGSEAVWKLRGKGGYYVMANRILGALSQAGDGNPERARARALAILAAAEFAGGAQ